MSDMQDEHEYAVSEHPAMTLDSLSAQLARHEKHSKKRFECLQEMIHTGEATMHGKDEVKVENIFKGGASGGEGGAPWASMLPALMTSQHGGWGGIGGGFGSGLVGGLLGGLLFGGRRGGLFGGDNDCCNGGEGVGGIERTIALKTLGDIQREVATSAGATQNVVNQVGAAGVQTTLQQTIGLQNALAQLAAGTLNNFNQTNENVNRSACKIENTVQTGNFALSNEILNSRFTSAEQACAIKQVVVDDGEKTRSLLTRQFETAQQTKLLEQNARIVELENEGRFAELRRQNDAISNRIEINNSAVAAQQQGQIQAQQQAQFGVINTLPGLLTGLINEFQIARAQNSNVIVGNTGATTTGAQTASPINVR
ncbi:MAG: hypothetical protein JO253_06040 [Alphaproteobacteria bacterium]|nr:hypothetical protein [Alphaproteobacteria bacterium]